MSMLNIVNYFGIKMVAWKICLLMVCLACSIGTSVGAGSYITSPSNTTSAVGATTRILCSVDIDISGGDEVYWHFQPSNPEDDTITIGPYTNRNPTGYPRLSIMNGYPEDSVYNLLISETVKADEGTYYCLIVNEGTTQMATAELAVNERSISPSGDPATCSVTASLPDMSPFTENEMVTLECVIDDGGVPLPVLQIIRITSSGFNQVIPSSTVIEDNGRTTETATFKLSYEDHEASYRCKAMHPAVDDEFSCDYTTSTLNPIQVMYSPVVSISPNELFIYDDDSDETVILECNVIANPPTNSSVEWTYKRNIITPATEDKTTSKLTLDGIRKSYIGQNITCTASNTIGSRSASIVIQEEDRLLPFETYILLIIIACGGLLLFFLTCICIICCCERDSGDDEEKNANYHVNESRQTSMRQQGSNEDDLIDGYDDFSGGSEANLVRDESHKSRVSQKSRASQRSGISEYTDNRSSVRSNDYNDVNTIDNQAYSPDIENGNIDDVEFNTPLY
ncbi:uncharacterized protein [Antedon mediterranea]|uniref:uncharacterized protein n=1 Tax=Antedon mediterranea TaxID=105859 RepID=UPI003AF86592